MPRRRAWIALLIFTGVIVNYVDRVALSVAAGPIADEFALSPVEMGYLLSSFLWTYVLALVPVGALVDRFGAKGVAGAGVVIWSGATAATALATGFLSLLAARLAVGASEATSFPAGGRVIRIWFPERERGLVTTLMNGGSTAGPALGAVLTGLLVSYLGWRWAFATLGLAGLVWLAAWLRWYDAPETVRWLADAERAEILRGRGGACEGKGGADRTDAPPSSILHLVQQATLWGLMATQACLVYTAYLFLTWLPSFLRQAHDLSVAGTGAATAVPYLVALGASLVIAWVSDCTAPQGGTATGHRRRFVAAMALASVPVALAPLVAGLVPILLLFTLVLTGATTGAGLNFALASDLLANPSDAARVTALVTLGGNLFGLIAPIVTGHIVAATGSYDAAFLVAAALLGAGSLSALLLTRRPIMGEPGTAASFGTAPGGRP